jgi:hypothetical protein
VILESASRLANVGFSYVAFIGLPPAAIKKVEWIKGTVIRPYTDKCTAVDLLNFPLKIQTAVFLQHRPERGGRRKDGRSRPVSRAIKLETTNRSAVPLRVINRRSGLRS